MGFKWLNGKQNLLTRLIAFGLVEGLFLPVHSVRSITLEKEVYFQVWLIK